MNRAALMNRIRELEQATGNASGHAGELPVIVTQEERDGAIGAGLRTRGYRVMTFDDFVDESV